MRWRRILIAAAGVVVVTGAVAWALVPRPLDVEVAAATVGLFEQTVDEDGRTQVRERYVVSASLAGRLARINLKAGDEVQANAVVATIAPVPPGLIDERTVRELEERLGAAEANRVRTEAGVARARTALEQARLDANRQQKLAREGFLSPAVREQYELGLKQAERGVEIAEAERHAAEHDEQQARAALTRIRGEAPGGRPAGSSWQVRSPVAGRVLRVVQASEGVVTPGMPLVEIGDPRALEATIDVLSQEALRLAPGMIARVSAGGGTGAVEGRVRRIEPSAFTKVSALGIEEQRVNVLIDLPQQAVSERRIGDNFRIEASIVVFRSTDALTIPVVSLVRERDGWAVFVVTEGRAARRAISVSRTNGRDAMVAAGLAAGEQVVMYPGDALRDGLRVRPRNSPR